MEAASRKRDFFLMNDAPMRRCGSLRHPSTNHRIGRCRMAAESQDFFRFADIEVDCRRYELRRAGQSIKLERQPMDLLILLLRRRPELVTRTEIIDHRWGRDTFVEADSSINTAVHKVRQALKDSVSPGPVIERVPGKGYRFTANIEVQHLNGGSRVSRIWPLRRAAMWVGIAVLVAALAGAWTTSSRYAAPAVMDAIPLTRLTGTELDPTFSPDGGQFAFAWDSARQDNFDIYVAAVGSVVPERLTSDPAADLAPQWSPDGHNIAYVRALNFSGVHQLRVMSSRGASDRAVSDFPVARQISWSLDGRFLAVSRASSPGEPPDQNGIYVIPVAGGTPRRLTHADGSGSHASPAFSPDGRRLAYASCREAVFRFDCHVQVVTVDAALQRIGSPVQVTSVAYRRISGISWTEDGAFILFGAGYGDAGLWRVRADGKTSPQRINEAGTAEYPAASRGGHRVAFTRATNDTDIYLFEPGVPVEPVAQYSMNDTSPDVASDGRIAFCSDRSGAGEIWVAAADGSTARQVTWNRRGCSPAWSPNGRSIAFDSVDDRGYYQIWTVSADGSFPRQLTAGPGDHNVPSWSHDGLWIYYSRDDGRGRNIWRTQFTAERSEQITHEGSGWFARESADGSGVYYPASTSPSPLLLQPLGGGPPRQVIPCLVGGSVVSVRPQGIYYLPCPAGTDLVPNQPVHVFDPASGKDREFGVLEAYHRPRDSYMQNFRAMAVSADGRFVLYTRRLAATGDLMLFENFR